MWLCSAEGFLHVDCYWSIEGEIRNNPCKWINSERIIDFIKTARKIKAILNAVYYLKENKSVPVNIWSDIDYDRIFGLDLIHSNTMHDRDLDYQKMFSLKR